MNLGGVLTYRGTRYFVALTEIKSEVRWHLVSESHIDDVIGRLSGKEPEHPKLTPLSVQRGEIPEPYIMESIIKARVSGNLKIYKGRAILSELMERIGEALTYSFEDQSIVTNQVSTNSGGELVREFEALDENLSFIYIRKNQRFSKLYLRNDELELDISEGFPIKIKHTLLDYKEVSNKIRGKETVATVTGVDYKTLRQMIDLSWYEKDGVILKDYKAIRNIQEFEDWVMTPIIEGIKKARAKGEKFELDVDTETSGLNFYDLSPDNPMNDEVVAIPITWEDDQGVVVFVDMEYFDNVPLDYVLSRLRGLMEGSEGEVVLNKRKVTKKEESEKPSGLGLMSSFGEEKSSSSAVYEDDTFIVEEIEEFVFDRSEIWLVGHNIMFDGRVFYKYKVKTYWNEDTLQLGFDLNPRFGKGSNKLKVYSKKLLGIDAPELSDILGKGNEDKYRYITDLEVAKIYGCGDTDKTRAVRKEMMKAVTPRFYKMYQERDVPMLNILYKVEYTGMPVNEENILKEGDIVEKDLAALRDFMYKYVGGMVDYRNQVNALHKKFTAGQLDEKSFHAALKAIKVNPDAYYEFKFGGDEMRNVLFSILNYPVTVRTAPTEKHPFGQPAVDKVAIERLMREELETPSKFMKSDFKSADGKTVLLKKDIFNKKKYPVAYFLQVYKDLDKDWTSTYKPIKEQNLEGRIYKGFSMARIETRRIMSPGQTLKAKTKKNIVALGPDWYLCDFDQMQVEPRIMVSLSGNEEDIAKFRDPEKDYHTETAAGIIKIPPHLLDKDTRKKYKEISLGIPYGLGAPKMCLKIYKKLTDRNLYETRKDIERWEKKNSDILKMLIKYRTDPLKAAELPDGLREFITKTTGNDYNTPYGQVTNPVGFYRLFDISDLAGNRKLEGKIMRPSGNFPIQSMAAEIFRIILLKFYRRCVQEGIEDKVRWHMLIHDELLFSVHKSVHPFFLYKILYETCNITFPGHTNYYVGINIGNSWADCKFDENEAPVIFVDQMRKRWDAGEFRDDDYVNATYSFENAKGKFKETGVKAYVLKHMREYIKNRIAEVVFEVQPSAKNGTIKLRELMDNFTNYMVRSYILMHYPKNSDPDVKGDTDYEYEAHFESWLLDYFGEGVEYVSLSGKLKKVYKGSVDAIDLSFLDEEEVEEETTEEVYWTFDDNEEVEYGEVVYQTYMYEKLESEDDEFLSQFDTSVKGAKNVADLAVALLPNFKAIRVANGQLFVKVGRNKNVTKAKEYLFKYKSDKGLQVVFETSLGTERWMYVDENIDLTALDNFAGGLVNAT